MREIAKMIYDRITASDPEIADEGWRMLAACPAATETMASMIYQAAIQSACKGGRHNWEYNPDDPDQFECLHCGEIIPAMESVNDAVETRSRRLAEMGR